MLNTKYFLLLIPAILVIGSIGYLTFDTDDASRLSASLDSVGASNTSVESLTISETSDVIVESSRPKLGNDGIGVSGWVVLEVFDKDGNLKFRSEDHNLVVDNGLETLADLAFGTTHSTGESAGGFKWISVGTSSTAPAAGQTDCIAQSGNKKQDASVTNTALGAVIDASWVAELPAVTLQEICLTDSGTNSTGNMFSRQTYAGVTISASDTVNAQWTITFADSNGS